MEKDQVSLLTKNWFESFLNIEDEKLAKPICFLLLLLLPYSMVYLLFPERFQPQNIYVFVLYSISFAFLFSGIPLLLQFSIETKKIETAKELLGFFEWSYSKARRKLTLTERKESKETISLLKGATRFNTKNRIIVTLLMLVVSFFIIAALTFFKKFLIGDPYYLIGAISIPVGFSLILYFWEDKRHRDDMNFAKQRKQQMSDFFGFH